MDINTEEEKEDYSLLDEKRKEQIILELKEEINKQKSLYLTKDFNNNNNTDKEIFKKSDNIVNNENKLYSKIKESDNGDNTQITNNLNIKNMNIYPDNISNDKTSSILKEINNFINNNDKNNNSHNNSIISNINTHTNGDNIMLLNNNNELEINEQEDYPLPEPQMINIIDNKIGNNNIDNIYNFSNNNFKEEETLNKNKYLNQINNKKNILFQNNNINLKINTIEKYKSKNNINKNKISNKKPKLKKGNSFNIKHKGSNPKNKSIKSAHIKKQNTVNSNNNNNKIIKKAKSTSKIRNINYSSNNIKYNNNNSIPRYINSNKKSKEKYDKIKIEINNKFKNEHPFKPIINTKYNENKLNETEDERYHRLSRPKTYEIKGKHLIKNEDEKLNNKNNKNNINVNKINPQEVSNRLYKLHQQIKEKKAQVQKIFEDKQMNKYSFAPELNKYSKKIMNKTCNNIPFNERNDNYIKQRKENMIKLREEIDKEIKEKSIPKINEKSKTIYANQNCINIIDSDYSQNENENNVFNRLYENKYFSNNIILELDKDDFTDIKPKNNINEINDFLERQKIFENLKKEHLYKNKIINNNNRNEEELTFKPKINSTSDIIARTNPERFGEDINDKYKRLYNEAAKIKEKKEQLNNFYSAQYDFKPKINELSKIIGNNILSNKKLISNNTLTDSIIPNTNISKIDIDNECTFKPKILTNEKYNYIQSNYKFDNNISQKIQEELNNKTNKMNILKSEQLYNYIKECKFMPETNKNISNLNLFNNNDIFYQKGLKKYMDQMDKAKQAKKEKEEREKKAFITGENWNSKNLKMTPKPFNLSKNNHKKKIDKIKEEIKNQEMKECSFKPITNESKNKDIVKKLLNE